MLVEPPRHHELVRRVDLSEIPSSANGAAIHHDYGDGPLAAHPKVSGPLRLAIEIRVLPPALDFVRGKRLKDTFGWHGNLCRRDDRPAPTVSYGAGSDPFRRCWRSEVVFALRVGCARLD